ncbi:MAG: hypothetical protein R2849_14065 [Thermomicrobiales bacterium]
MDFGYVLHLKPDDKPETLFWTFGGMIGYHGLNAAGVAQFANDHLRRRRAAAPIWPAPLPAEAVDHGMFVDGRGHRTVPKDTAFLEWQLRPL